MDKVSLVFIHGAGLNKACWENQVTGLSDLANTIAVDLPGHGDSRLSGKEKIFDYARAVTDFLDLIHPPNPVLCGISMGGAIVQQMLINDKDRFQAAVLINTGARLKVMPLIFETLSKSHSDFVDMTIGFGISPKSDAKKLGPQIATCSQCHPQVVWKDFCACDTFDVTRDLGAIKVPVLILTAGDDIITPPKYGIFLEKNIKNARRQNIEDAGHFSPMENPHAVNAAIRDFLLENRINRSG
ncbi:MAG: alpha/beta hydrolase [Proteobacteria bacterium]|nr:alpha/beta hydrolase [Pseudomonadota bacterium]MBU4130714.1 alpha/beta hydrolase [Pseudomonadota bacterium]